jgi:hypothetical protein
MIRYCPCGRALPHPKTQHCEKPRIRVPQEPVKPTPTDILKGFTDDGPGDANGP